MKAVAVQEALLTIGVVVISSILIATQIPSMASDIQEILSKESVKEKSQDIADLLVISTSAPNEIKLVYSFPVEKSYDVFIKDGYVNVSSDEEWAISKTIVLPKEFAKTNARILTITKTISGIEVE